MTLEKMLKPVKYVDEQVLRSYTNLTHKLEEKGENKYSLAAKAFASSCIAYLIYISGYTLMEPMNGANEIGSIIFDIGAAGVFGGLLGNDLASLLQESRYQNIQESGGAKAKLPLELERYKKITSAVRLPLLAAGTYMLGQAGIDGLEPLISWSSEPLTLDTLKNTLLGSGAVSFSLFYLYQRYRSKNS